MQKNNARITLRFALWCCVSVNLADMTKSAVCHGSTILSADFLRQLNHAHKSWPTSSIVWHPVYEYELLTECDEVLVGRLGLEAADVEISSTEQTRLAVRCTTDTHRAADAADGGRGRDEARC